MIKDRIGLKAFGNNLEDNCLQLSNKIINGGYKPRKGIKFYMPKASMTQRTKTLLFIEDALIYQAIANRIGENVLPKVRQHEHFVYGSVLSKEVGKGLAILEEKEPEYYFFKFWRNLYQQFAASIINTVEKDKVRYKFETDITGFFDSIPHYNLLSALSTDFEVEDEILDILSECLNKWSGTKERSTPGVGIPQGPAPSYLFANLSMLSFWNCLAALSKASVENCSLAGKSAVPINLEMAAFNCFISERISFSIIRLRCV